jgi:hypothetical protein
VSCQNNEPQAGLDDVLVNVHEKRCRLWWETVTPASLDVEPVKIVDSLATADNDCAHIAALRLANSTTDLAVEAIGYFLDAAAEIERMPVEFRCRTRGGLKEFTSANFQVFPAAFPRETNEAISYCVGYFWIKDERLAHIAEWKADAAAPGERTSHFHQRY